MLLPLLFLGSSGGILVFLIGFHMLQGKPPADQPESSEIDIKAQKKAALGLAISPLATPILAGPSTIATAMNFAASGGFSQLITTIVSFGLLCILTYFLFVFGERFVKAIGPSALDVVTRMMGLILAVIGMQMLIEGIDQAYKAFL